MWIKKRVEVFAVNGRGGIAKVIVGEREGEEGLLVVLFCCKSVVIRHFRAAVSLV